MVCVFGPSTHVQVEVAGTWIVTRSGVSLGSLMPTNRSRCRGLVPCGWPREYIDTLLPTSQPIVDMAVLYGNSLTWWYYPHIRTHTASPRYLAVNHELLLLIKHGFTNIFSAPHKAPKIKTAIANQKKKSTFSHLLSFPLLPPPKKRLLRRLHLHLCPHFLFLHLDTPPIDPSISLRVRVVSILCPPLPLLPIGAPVHAHVHAEPTHAVISPAIAPPTGLEPAAEARARESGHAGDV